MKIIIGSDHAGFKLKKDLISYLQSLEIEVDDKGTYSLDSVNYPDYAHEVAKTVLKDKNNLGILICGSANGVCMTANKYKKIRAAIAWQPEIAALAKQHNNANILCLPARYISTMKAKIILTAYLDAGFEGGRHQKRVQLI
ncbi:ribose 5-phosphate isomerase B [Chitinophagales bacterium]|jgi:ribose 5-phosphate isomerase B|nr:ribose 5-phosphate isomerase B [Chitinophagales bacterium]|tara:strand:- start:188 stop:610 length:423 start_codon:yes stop_codon:yes gene_type:complete